MTLEHGCDCRKLGGDPRLECCKRCSVDVVVGPETVALDVDQDRLAQQPQVVGDGRLLDWHRRLDIADLSALPRQDVQDLEPNSMAQDLVVSGKLLCGFHVQARSS